MNLPDFAGERLQILTICCHMESPELLGRLQGNRFEGNALYGESHWAHLLTEVITTSGDEERAHIHLDFTKSLRETNPPDICKIDELVEVVNSLRGQAGWAWVRARYIIPSDDFPRDGIVGVFLGMPTEAGGSTLSVQGMRLTTEDDDDEVDDIEWWQNREGNIVVEIDAFVPVSIDDVFLRDAEAVLSDGVNRYLLGLDDDEKSGAGS